jgi:hypothetical protein
MNLAVCEMRTKRRRKRRNKVFRKADEHYHATLHHIFYDKGIGMLS